MNLSRIPVNQNNSIKKKIAETQKFTEFNKNYKQSSVWFHLFCSEIQLYKKTCAKVDKSKMTKPVYFPMRDCNRPNDLKLQCQVQLLESATSH